LKRRIARNTCGALVNARFDQLTRPFFGGIGHILNFHNVLPRSRRPRLSSVSALEVTPEWLEDSIGWYRANNVEIVSLDEMHAILSGEAPVREFVVYTFDDGFEDNYSYAWPVFRRCRAPFTVYLAAGFPDRNVIPWWKLIEDLTLASPDLRVAFNGRDLRFDCSTAPGRESAFYVLRSLILDSCGGDYEGTLRQIFEPNGIDVHRYNGAGMSWKQVRELSVDPLVTIGAHSVHHLPLSKLRTAEMESEIAMSRQRIEAQIGKPVDHFSFPFGSSAEAGSREFDAVKAAGYKSAVTTRAANIFPEHSGHLFCLPRNLISGEREGLNTEILRLWIGGVIPALENGFHRVVTA